MFAMLKNGINAALGESNAHLIVKTHKMTISLLEDTILPTVKKVEECAYLTHVKKSPLLKFIFSSIGVQGASIQEKVHNFGYKLMEIVNHKVQIEELIRKFVNGTITPVGGTARDIAINKMVNDLASIARYTMELLHYVVTDQKSSIIPAKRFKLVEKYAPSYIDLCKIYLNNLPKIIKDLEKVSNEYVNVKNDDKADLQNTMLANTGKSVRLPMNGFIGNPFYHIRAWWIDKRTETVEYLEQKKTSIEYKINLLKAQQDGKNDPELEKQIRNYEETIDRLDYQIEKIDPLH